MYVSLDTRLGGVSKLEYTMAVINWHVRQSHPTVRFARFRSDVSERLRSSREEPPVYIIMLLIEWS